MQAMSDRVAALARLVAAVERGEDAFALEVAPDGATGSRGAAPVDAAGRLPVPAAGHGFARGRGEGTTGAAGFLRGAPSPSRAPSPVPAARRARSMPAVAAADTLVAGRAAAPPRLALGVAAVDAVLGGGLDPAGLHEIHAAGPGDEAAAAGFVAALAALSLALPSGPMPPGPDGTAALAAALSGRPAPAAPLSAGTAHGRIADAAGKGGVSSRPPLIRPATGAAIAWIETRFSAAEDGLLWPAGLDDLGLDPGHIVRVSLGRVVDALAAAEEALACAAVAATVLEIRGAAPALDLVALRRLTLAARARGRPCLLLRTGAAPMSTPALTRWAIAASPSGRAGAAAGAAFRRQLGLPAVAATLQRQRAGRDGAWNLEWCADGRCFREPLPQPALSVSGDRPADPRRRHAG